MTYRTSVALGKRLLGKRSPVARDEPLLGDASAERHESILSSREGWILQGTQIRRIASNRLEQSNLNVAGWDGLIPEWTDYKSI